MTTETKPRFTGKLVQTSKDGSEGTWTYTLDGFEYYIWGIKDGFKITNYTCSNVDLSTPNNILGHFSTPQDVAKAIDAK